MNVEIGDEAALSEATAPRYPWLGCKCGKGHPLSLAELNGREQSLLLVGEYKLGVWLCRVDPRTRKVGDVGSVGFDWEYVIKRADKVGDLVGWIHTHPEGFPEISQRDRDTMKAWYNYLGVPLICAIATSAGVKAWLYDDIYDGFPMEVIEFKRHFLMELAYG